MKPIIESTDGIVSIVPQMGYHAADMYQLLLDADLYSFTNDHPPATAHALADRYENLESRRSPDGSQWWLNWVIKKVETDELIGYVQATVVKEVADIAWVVGVRHQRHGYATMATRLMVAQLSAMDCQAFSCHIKPGHVASNRVAQKLGFTETDLIKDGEKVWRMNMVSEQGDPADGLTAATDL